MYRTFRTSIRVALALLLLGSCGLLVYAFVTRPGNELPQDGAPPPQQERDGEQSGVVMRNWQMALPDDSEQSRDAELKGELFEVSGEGVYDVSKPRLLVPEKQGIDVELGSVRLTANKGTYDKSRRMVRLYEDVRARGEDFEVRANEVVYALGDRSLTGTGHVEIETERRASAESTTPEMLVTGTGLRVDLTLETMTLESDVQARLYGVSRDFLGTGQSGQESAPHDANVVITADGQMVYEHLSRKVVFKQNCVATFRGRRLRADELTIQLERTGDGENLEVGQVVGTGNVELAYLDQVARGSRLEWHNVLQTGTLLGDPCTLQTLQFNLSGKELTFYQLNQRFDAKGAGELRWNPSEEPATGGEAGESAPQPAEQSADPPAATPLEGNPLSLTAGQPLSVSWQESMTHDVQGSFATFTGGVVVHQGGSMLRSEALKLRFDETGTGIAGATATGAVTVEDAESGREVACHEFAWDAEKNTVELAAADQQNVSIAQGGMRIFSPKIVLRDFGDGGGTVDSPAPGRMEMAEGDAESDASTGTTVTWQRSMSFAQGATSVAKFRGSVKVSAPQESIQAGALDVEFVRDNGALEPQKLIAEGDVALLVSGAGGGLANLALADAASGAPGDAEPEVSRWRLNAEIVTIRPAQQTIETATPGTLSMLRGETVVGTVSWQKAARLDSETGLATFEGAVEADMPDGDLKCERLTLSFSQDGTMRHGAASGQVDFQASGENPWRLRCDSAEAIFVDDGALRQFIARDEVKVDDANRSLTCDTLTLFLSEPEGSTRPTITRATASGNVWLRYEREDSLQASGDELTWNAEDDIYVLTGDPARLERGQMVSPAPRITLHRTTGRTVSE